MSTRAFHFDFPELLLGTAEDKRGPTGVTAILFPTGAQVACDARGGAVAAREVLSADPLNEWGECDGVVFAGGSTYGLEAASGVMRKVLEARGTVDGMEIPSVPAAVVYDFAGRSNQVFPDAALGAEAFDKAKPNEVVIGRAGAGANTSVGHFFGDEYAQKSGQGAAFIEVGGLKIFALCVVNALGNIRDRAGRFVAGGRPPGAADIVDVASHLYHLIETESGHASDPDKAPSVAPIFDAEEGAAKRKAPPKGAERIAAGDAPPKAYQPKTKSHDDDVVEAKDAPVDDVEASGDAGDGEAKQGRKGPGKSTTLTCVVTNVALNRLELKRVAVMVHGALGRVVDPFHTPEDGDIAFACSTASLKMPKNTTVADVGVLAGRCAQDAVLSTFST